MAQLTIYLDDDVFRGVKEAAQRDHLSVSRWARSKLLDGLTKAWPSEYFTLFGVLADSDLKRPPQGEAGDDLPRETL